MNLRVVAVETFHSESILSAKMPANTPLTAMVAHGNAENHELVAKFNLTTSLKYLGIQARRMKKRQLEDLIYEKLFGQ